MTVDVSVMSVAFTLHFAYIRRSTGPIFRTSKVAPTSSYLWLGREKSTIDDGECCSVTKTGPLNLHPGHKSWDLLRDSFSAPRQHHESLIEVIIAQS